MSEQLNYNDAVSELESILSQLETSAVDVDELATRLARATELIKFCKSRLEKVDSEVTKVLEGLTEVNADSSDA